MNDTAPPPAAPLLNLTGKGAFALCLILAALGAWIVLELLADADYPAGQRRVMGALCLAGSGFAALVTGLLSRRVAASLAGWTLGVALGAGGYHLLEYMTAQHVQAQQTGRREAIERVLAQVAAPHEPAALGAAMNGLPLSVPALFCVLGELDNSPAASTYAPAPPVASEVLMQLGAALAAAGDAAAPLPQRQLALRYVLAAAINRNEPARLPEWLALWRRNQPGGRADTVELADAIGWDAPEDCPNNTGADEVGEVFRAWGGEGLRAWRAAGFGFSAAQQYSVFAQLGSPRELDEAIAAGMDLNASPYPGAGPIPQTALLKQAQQLGFQLGAAPADADMSRDVDLIAHFIARGADLRSRDEQGRDACASLREGLRQAREYAATPDHPALARAEGLLCRAAAPSAPR